jgi:hypothetical protein
MILRYIGESAFPTGVWLSVHNHFIHDKKDSGKRQWMYYFS